MRSVRANVRGADVRGALRGASAARELVDRYHPGMLPLGLHLSFRDKMPPLVKVRRTFRGTTPEADEPHTAARRSHTSKSAPHRTPAPLRALLEC